MPGEAEVVAARLKQRLPSGADADSLAAAYITAAAKHAVAHVADLTPVPTSLTVERAALMMKVSKELNRLVTVGEIAALLRLQRTTALSIHKAMVATYTDEANPLAVAWSLDGCRNAGKGEHLAIKAGHRLVFRSKRQLEEFETAMERLGIQTERKREDDKDFLLVVEKTFDPTPYDLKDWGK